MRLIRRLFKFFIYSGFSLLLLYFIDYGLLQQLRLYVVLFTHKIVTNVAIMSERVDHLVSWGHFWLASVTDMMNTPIEHIAGKGSGFGVALVWFGVALTTIGACIRYYKRRKSFTIYADKGLNQLLSDVKISRTLTLWSKKNKFTALWDTGATISAVTKNVARKCNLEQAGTTLLATASTTRPIEVPTYYVNIILHNGIVFKNIRVAEMANVASEETDGQAEILIGMDIIEKGDLTVGSFQGRTAFTFRMSSV